MGMFDTLFCDMPLPDGFNADGKDDFQTKDLGCFMDLYRITAEGRLILEDSFFAGTQHQAEDQEYHGYVVFYTGEGDYNSS